MVGLGVFIVLAAVAVWSWILYELYKAPEVDEKGNDKSDTLFDLDGDEEFLG
jgi:hypothetical protein